MGQFSEIPIIDLSALWSEDEQALDCLAHEFYKAYSETGFGYILNHGVPSSLVEQVFEASKQFHALPLKSKMAVELNEIHRGFIPINTSTDVNSTLAEVKKPNQSESFMMMREDELRSPGIYLSGPNLWPELGGFRETVTAYNDRLSELGFSLMKLVVRALNTDEQKVLPAFEKPTTWLRLLHYPPTEPTAPEDLYGSAPHTDFGCLTILAQDDVGGLQVMTSSGQWVDAPVIPGAFVINVGDMLNLWSNGLLLSTPHRVINRSGRERYSCPFFFDPHVSTVIEPLASCVSQENPSRFAPLNFGDFLRSELEAGYDKHKSNEKEGEDYD